MPQPTFFLFLLGGGTPFFLSVLMHAPPCNQRSARTARIILCHGSPHEGSLAAAAAVGFGKLLSRMGRMGAPPVHLQHKQPPTFWQSSTPQIVTRTKADAARSQIQYSIVVVLLVGERGFKKWSLLRRRLHAPRLGRELDVAARLPVVLGLRALPEHAHSQIAGVHLPVAGADDDADVADLRGASWPQTRKRDHPRPSLSETTHVKEVKAPQHFKTPRSRPPSPRTRPSRRCGRPS